MKTRKFLWCVLQTQPSAEYDQRTIAIYENEDDAKSLARRLNKVYGGDNCVFDEDWDFVEYTGDYDLCHYYETDCVELNPNANDYLWSADE